MKAEDIEKVLRENIVIQRSKDGPDYISNSTFKKVSILLESVCLPEITDEVIDQYPDTEADGYVFCGKCGKMK